VTEKNAYAFDVTSCSGKPQRCFSLVVFDVNPRTISNKIVDNGRLAALSSMMKGCATPLKSIFNL
jgi:hypothetical protein